MATTINILNSTTFKSSKPDAAIFTNGGKNITIKNISFTSNDFTSVGFAAYSSSTNGQVKNIKMYGNATNKCGLVWVSPANGFSYNRVDEPSSGWDQTGPVYTTDIAEDVHIFNNYIKGDMTLQLADFNTNRPSGVSLLYCKNSSAKNNTISHTYFGIWAYGGGTLSSDKMHNTVNPIFSKNIDISYNTVDTNFSPFWASRVESAKINFNTSVDTLDVAADFEGCINSVAHGNIITNSNGGALTPLNGCNNIKFIGNTVVYNKDTTQNNNNILVKNASDNIEYTRNSLVRTGNFKGKLQFESNNGIRGSNNVVFKYNTITNVFLRNTNNSDVSLDSTNVIT